MALGIDGVAHRACLEAGGITIAVLGSGFENIYPKEHQELFYDILKNGGAVITEYPPNVKPSSKNFPKRNRIISGLAKGILVVEAAYRSGTSITAKFAKEQEKEIFCIPSNLDSTHGVGTNYMIQQGAKLVTKPQEILEKLGIEDKEIEINKKEKNKIQNNWIEDKIKNELGKEYYKIYKAIKNNPMTANELKRELKIQISEINAMLTMLELEGYITKMPGSYFI